MKLKNQGIGSRKTARATVFINDSKNVTVNNKSLETYFKEVRFIENILSPIQKTSLELGFSARVHGGGISAQAWALRYALSRVIAENYPEFKKTLKTAGLLSGDARAVERKKVGRYKARAKYPFNRR